MSARTAVRPAIDTHDAMARSTIGTDFLEGVQEMIWAAACVGNDHTTIDLGRLDERKVRILRQYLERLGYATHMMLPGMTRDSLRITW